GEMVAGGKIDEGDRDPDVRDDVIERIRAGLTTLLPRTAAIPAGHVWCCFRPATADEQPVIDRVQGLENAWVTCGHFRTGILMAAGTGDVRGRWIRARASPEGRGPVRVGGLRGRGRPGGGSPFDCPPLPFPQPGTLYATRRSFITPPARTDIPPGFPAEPDTSGGLPRSLPPADLDAPTRCAG